MLGHGLARVLAHTGWAKNSIFAIAENFLTKLNILQQRIQAIYTADVVTIFGMIKKLQQLEL